MNHEDLIPSAYINSKLKEMLPEDVSITLAYKRELKNAIVLFIHYLMTYSEEISIEKGLSQINISVIKEALMETDFEDLYKRLDDIIDDEKERNAEIRKRKLEDLSEGKKN